MSAPNTEENEDKLERACGWLLLACEDHVKHHFGKDDLPLTIWTALHKTFAENRPGFEVERCRRLKNNKSRGLRLD